MLGAAPHRALTRSIKNSVTMVELPSPAPGTATCRYVQLTSSVPALVRLAEKPIETKDKDGKDLPVTLSVGESVIYLPPDVPVTVVSGQRLIYVRSLDKDGIFCAAPLSSM
ncbi:MAG: hypothetical protein ACRCU1_08465 [Alsobacter sp.]